MIEATFHIDEIYVVIYDKAGGYNRRHTEGEAYIDKKEAAEVFKRLINQGSKKHKLTNIRLITVPVLNGSK